MQTIRRSRAGRGPRDPAFGEEALVFVAYPLDCPGEMHRLKSAPSVAARAAVRSDSRIRPCVESRPRYRRRSISARPSAACERFRCNPAHFVLPRALPACRPMISNASSVSRASCIASISPAPRLEGWLRLVDTGTTLSHPPLAACSIRRLSAPGFCTHSSHTASGIRIRENRSLGTWSKSALASAIKGPASLMTRAMRKRHRLRCSWSRPAERSRCPDCPDDPRTRSGKAR